MILALIKLLEHLADALGALFAQEARQCFVLLRCLDFHLFDAEVFQQVLLRLDQFADRFVAEVDGFNDIAFR